MLAKINGNEKALPNPGCGSMRTEALTFNNSSTVAESHIPHLQNGVIMSTSASP